MLISCFIVTLIGSNAVGKSSILGRYTKNKFDGDKKATQGPEFCCRTSVVAQKAVKAQIWDTSGQEKFFTITRGFVSMCCLLLVVLKCMVVICRYYRNSLGVILVYDITSKESFESLDHWLNDIRNWAPDAIILLIGNKCDKSSRQVTRDSGVNYAQENNIDLFFEASALDGTNIADAFTALLGGNDSFLFVQYFSQSHPIFQQYTRNTKPWAVQNTSTSILESRF